MSQAELEPTAFSPEAFTDHLTQLGQTWQATWQVFEVIGGAPFTRGPYFLSYVDTDNPALSTEQIAVEQPEKDAYFDLVNEVANGIAVAMQSSQQAQATDRFLSFVRDQVAGSWGVSATDVQILLGDVFKQTLSEIAGDTGNSSED